MTERTGARVGTGIRGLDEILLGGVPRDRIYLLQGEPGSGKTTLAMQFLLEGVQRGERGLYVSLSETEEEIRAVADSHGWSLDGLALYELSAVEADLHAEENTLFHPSEVELYETTRTLLEQVERVAPTRVVFDSLSELRLLAQSPLRYRRQILALKQFFAGRKCTVLLLDDLTSESGDLQLQSLAHGVIILEHVVASYGNERRRLRVLKMRGVPFRGGYHDFAVQTGGLAVFPRLVARDHQREFAREQVPSGSAPLDMLLGGGLDRGTSTLIVGPPGSAKSVLTTQFAVAAAASGEHVALFTFEEASGTLFARSAALGMDLRPHVDSGRISLRPVDPAEMSPGEFDAMVRDSVEQRGTRMVIIDSLTGYLNAMYDQRFLPVQMHELLSYLGRQGVVTLMVLPNHGLLGANLSASVDVSYLADTVILMRIFEAAGAVRRAISVTKKRGGRHEDTIRELRMGPRGLSLGEPLAEYQGVLTGVPTFTREPRAHDGTAHERRDD